MESSRDSSPIDLASSSGGNSQQAGAGGATASQPSHLISPPAITIPKGGGAIRGMGEKFAANPVTGTGAMSVPIATSPGRSGFGPQLSLSYDSGAGNGPFGFGWNQSLPSITRKTDKGLPRYRDAEESDSFILSGAEDLVPVLVQSGEEWKREEPPMTRTVANKTYVIQRYHPRIEGLFARIERWTNERDPGDSFWRSISRDNITTWYGRTEESRIYDPANHTRIFSWLICESHDDKGNVMAYQYKPEDSINIVLSQAHEANRTDDSRGANRYLKRIYYGNLKPHFPKLIADQPWPEHPGAGQWMFEVVFDYGEHDPTHPMPSDDGDWDDRQDPFSTYRAGFEVRTYRLCQRVLMFHHFPDEDVGRDCLVRSTDFTYAYEQQSGDPKSAIYTFLQSVTQTGYQKLPDGTYQSKSLPPLEFSYSQPDISQEIETLDTESLENLPVGLDGTLYQWVDLDGEGLSGILTEQSTGWFYKRNLSPINTVRENNRVKTRARFASIKQVASRPSLAAFGGGQQQFLDLAGDGQLDLAVFEDPTPGFYERTHDEDWATFRAFESLPVLDWRNPNLKFIDITGDGHADILISEEEVFCWYPSLAESGFGPPEAVRKTLDEETSPHIIFADGSQSIHLGDLSGDGLSDVVRIRNGEICYWSNLGYGRFGAKVIMDNAPTFDHPDQFNQQRIRLADIDGSGTTDVIYLGRESIQIVYNESGNSWSAPHILHHFPRTDNLIAVNVLDLLGNGTACLVWSSPLPADAGQPMRYLKLMGENKPHLLTKVVNNLGAETHVHYAPSTKFYLQDRQNGTPWITKIPFPVHVVEQVETIDWISKSRFTSHYAYHHGYFDGIEREFRGFGMVEQWDTEEYTAIVGKEDFLKYTNIDKSSHVPPVHTKTWYHNGAYLGGAEISLLFAKEYYGAPSPDDPRYAGKFSAFVNEQLLPDTVLERGLTVEEEREACRALKGSMLRQEVYADDGTNKAMHPYTVTEQNFTVRRLQPRDGDYQAVFFAHARETINYHYERNPEDPRIMHALTLEVDEFGNVLKSLAIGYGRRQQDVDLSAKDQVKQTQILITCTENDVTNAIEADDDYRTPLTCEVRTYEVTGLEPEDNSQRFGFDHFVKDDFATLGDLDEIDYEQSPGPEIWQKRLIEKVRTLYRKNDLSGLLEQCQLESRALAGETYKLAFTPGLLEQVYQHSRDGQPTEKLLPGDVAEVLAVDEPGAEFSGRGGYVELDGDGCWWIPSGRVFFSPGEGDTPAAEHDYSLQHFFTPHRYRDPFGHFATLNLDYDLLIRETRDALKNITSADNDFRVLQPKQMTDPNGNRTAVAFDALGMVVATAVMGKEGETNPENIGDTLSDPTTRLAYELFAWRDHGQPNFVHTFAREQHGAANPRWQESILYSDGFGRELQTKIQAEPGEAPCRDPATATLYKPGTLLKDANGRPLLAHTEGRWVGTGRTVYNNKGKPVKQYEPFFSSTPLYEDETELVETGVTPILFYDPVERVVATLHPNHTYEKVVFDPWRQETWDVNDTLHPLETYDPRSSDTLPDHHFNPVNDPDVGHYFQRLPKKDYLPTWYELRMDAAQAGAEWPDEAIRENERKAAEKSVKHASTPAIAYLDSLGRTFLTIADNGLDEAGHERKYATRVELDIESNQRAVIDAKDRVVMHYEYDMLGNRIHQASMEAGERWILNDFGGDPIRAWDSRGHRFHNEYDKLRRPVRAYVTGSSPANPGRTILAERVIYGESPAAKLSENERLEANLRGKPYKQFDNVGIITNIAYDFKGNLLESRRRLTQDYKNTPDWSQGPALEDEVFTSSTRYDALNRPIQIIAQHDVQRADIHADVIQPVYNEANLLDRLDVWLQHAGEPNGMLDPDTADLPAVRNIDYNAKGQRTLIEYGNGVTTRYEYDPETFRLSHLFTQRRPAYPEDCTNSPQPPCGAQNLHYTYDPVGNITHIRDDAQQMVFFRNQVVEPSCEYTYDAIYRLIAASGREHLGQSADGRTLPPVRPSHTDAPRTGLPHPGDRKAMGLYLQEYVYDEVGNILEMIHHGTETSQGWKRCYQYAIDSNRLLSTGGPNDLQRPDHPCASQNPNDACAAHYAPGPVCPEGYAYDAHGNMTSMPHLSLMRWDYQDQLQATARQVVNNDDTPETTYYVYDADGQRVRKVTEGKADAGETPRCMKERIYLGGFELYREYEVDGITVGLERQTLHILDDQQRIAMVETRTQGEDESPVRLVRYQFGNHLGSVMLELDEGARVISYEEYYPYGSSSYQAVDRAIKAAAKRYRYTGKERDEETGLYYHGARYYAAWLGRWTSVEPAGALGGVNGFYSADSNPITMIDPTGYQAVDWSKTIKNAQSESIINEMEKTDLESNGTYFSFLG